MAPTIRGAHLQANCLDCQYEFTAETAENRQGTLTCPNCGYRKVDVAEAAVIPAAEVQLKPFAKFPRRWEVVGFELPKGSDDETGVKRIVGLPGETIEIKQGDLFANESILRKSWALQKQVRIPVFDSKFNAIAPFDNTKRFRPVVDDATGWRVAGEVLKMVAPAGDVDWLDYVHWRNCKRNGDRDEAFPVADNYGFNQQTARELKETDDLMIRLDAEFEMNSTMVLAFRRHKAEFVFEIAKAKKDFSITWRGESQRKPLVYQSLVEDESFDKKAPIKLARGVVEFSSFDRSLILRVNGTTVFEILEDENASAATTESNFPAGALSVFRIGGSRGSFRINRTRIWRDLYYLAAPAEFADRKTLKLTAGPKEYILLGDNSPKSLDSRVWEKPGIARDKLIGRLESPFVTQK